MDDVAALPWGRELTRADLDALPDDGHRYELLEGALLVTPAPGPAHQMAAFELAKMLDAACAGTDLVVFVAPLEVAFSELTVLQPDVVVARRDQVDDRGISGPPVLVVEVLSPSTRRIDLGSKRAAYEAAVVEHYWVVDPDVPAITAWRLHAGAYAEAGSAAGDEEMTVAEPVAVTVVPAALLDPLNQ